MTTRWDLNIEEIISRDYGGRIPIQYNDGTMTVFDFDGFMIHLIATKKTLFYYNRNGEDFFYLAKSHIF